MGAAHLYGELGAGSLSTRRTSYSLRANQHATRGTEAMPVRVTPRATEDLEP